MKFQLLAFIVIVIAIVVSACGSSITGEPVVAASGPSEGEQSNQSKQITSSVWEQMVQVDEQGAIVIEVTPLNLNTPAEKLEFEISMNTHSVDLSMDLALLATLTTDAGITVDAAGWDAPRGGHHVNGKLLFPSTVDGTSVLAGATDITIQIRDVDASLRTFAWHVQ